MLKIISLLILSFFVAILSSKCQTIIKHEDTEYYTPVPKKITTANNVANPPSDAVILFDGKNEDQWVSVKGTPAKWSVHDGIMTIDKKEGNIQTKNLFNNYQLHIEWMIPKAITGEGQLRGNSGIFLASTGPGNEGYELQIMDSYDNSTYVNGQAGSIFKQYAPMVNACRKPGTWQIFDVVWIAPVFNDDSTLKSAARCTVFHNGILIQHDEVLNGETTWLGKPFYKKHGKTPIKLQAHNDPSEPISFRNIWLREL